MSSQERRANPHEISFWRVAAIAGPVAIANVTAPLQGAVDTAVIGRLGDIAALAAVGMGAEFFSLLYSGFNFLQIGASGLTAQAIGARKFDEAAAILIRGLAVGVSLALLILLCQKPLQIGGLAIFEASAAAESRTAQYYNWRIWGAPAELMNYVVVGWLAGQEQIRKLFLHQTLLAGLNIALSIFLVAGLGLGVPGVGLGTMIASWLGLFFGLWLAFERLTTILPNKWRMNQSHLWDRQAFKKLFALNRDLFIRTILLVGAFVWMMRLGSQLGDSILAVNVVLWQFFIVSAYFMDGFAIAAETLVGQAVGAQSRLLMDRAVKMVILGGVALAFISTAFFVALFGLIVDLFSTAPEIRALAREYMTWAAFIPLIGVWAFMYDGIFVGATGAAQMRNGMIISTGIFVPISMWFAAIWGNHGLWAAIWIWLLIRALVLMAFYPTLQNKMPPPKKLRL